MLPMQQTLPLSVNQVGLPNAARPHPDSHVNPTLYPHQPPYHYCYAIQSPKGYVASFMDVNSSKW